LSQESNWNVCQFCNEWDHHQRICSQLLHLISENKIHLNEKLCIAWRSEENRKSMMFLNSFIQQLNSVCMLLEKKNWCNHANIKQHKTNLLDLQCDSDSDLEKNNLLSIFKYQILSIKTSSLSVATQNNQKKHDCECSLNSILNKNIKITKEKIQKEHKLFTSKILCSDKWKTS